MTDYAALVGEFAAPRLVGSPEHRRVRGRLKEELARRGYVNLEHEFRFVPPGALAGPAWAGGVVFWASLVLGAWRGLGATGAWLLAVMGLGGGVVAVSLRAMYRGRALLGAVNVVAVRPRARVTLWLAAHYDSKGQPVSMLARIGAVGLAALGAAAVPVLGIWRAPVLWALALALPGLVGGLVLLQNRATNRSPGAVDNASALVTVLATLDRLPADAPVGVLWLDAEEYGLVGAKALARERPHLFNGAAVVNLDGIDDRGPTRCLIHRPGPRTTAVAQALGARTGGLLPVVEDGRALAPVALECATIMRGGWRTAAIVHTLRDRPERLTLLGCETVASGLARALAPELRVDAGSRAP